MLFFPFFPKFYFIRLHVDVCRNSRIDIQSQIYRNTNNQSLPYYLYIWLTSSWPLSNHSSMRTLTSNRCIVTLHLANFIVTLIQSQFYRNIDIQSIYRYLFANFIVILIQSIKSIETLTYNRYIVTLYTINFIVTLL